jgi:secreted trypsin-like serine protease
MYSINQVCAGNINGGKGTCQGDSGGALYVFDKSINRYVIAGITSVGIG